MFYLLTLNNPNNNYSKLIAMASFDCKLNSGFI